MTGRGESTLIDTHCHLDAEAFASEPVSAVLGRAADAGVARIVTIGIDLPSSRRAVAIAEANTTVYATVGVDPTHLEGFDERAVAEIESLAGSGRVVAIGEIGLDYYWDRAPRAAQEQAFRSQLDLAGRLGLPVVIHNREAHADTVRVLTEWASTDPLPGPLGVLHCYSGDLPMAERLVELGFLVSLAGNVTYRSAHALHEVAAELAEEALVLETDAPYLSPQAHRGRRNEPAHLPRTAERVAELRGCSPAYVAAFTSRNAERLFRLGDAA